MVSEKLRERCYMAQVEEFKHDKILFASEGWINGWMDEGNICSTVDTEQRVG